MKYNMYLSIIIPTKNEEKYLPFLLESISIQKIDFEYEVIVSDAFSKDSTRNIAKKYWAKVCDGWLPWKWRNAWAKIAQWKWLLFLDADTTIKKQSLKEWFQQLEQTNSQVATPYIEANSKEKHFWAKIYFKSSYIWYNFFSCAYGAAIIIKKDLFDLIGGFNEDIYLLEDVDIVKRATKYTKRLNLFPKVLTSPRRFILVGAFKMICYTSWWYILSMFWYFHKKNKKNSKLYKL